jgi:hypothetical protein
MTRHATQPCTYNNNGCAIAIALMRAAMTFMRQPFHFMGKATAGSDADVLGPDLSPADSG